MTTSHAIDLPDGESGRSADDPSAPALGRRELNKARTRERLLEALRAQLTQSGLETMTVEAVAEAAGVSRRTFFNYFTSIEAALAEGMSVPIEGLAEAFGARPLDEPPLLAMQRALQVTPIPIDLLNWIAVVKCSGIERQHAVGVNVWGYHRDWLEGLLRARQPAAEDLAVASLAGAVMAIFEAVEATWIDTASELDEVASAARFNDLLRRGLEHAQHGWATTPLATTGLATTGLATTPQT